MSETATAPKAAKKETVYSTVEMENGEKVDFAGNRQVIKKYEVDTHHKTVEATFYFRNGSVRKIGSKHLDLNTQLTALGHGLVQKIGDEWSGEKDIEDIVLTADTMIERLGKGEWGTVREAGDSMAGASVVIRAIMEATGKDVATVKAFLDGKLEAAKGRGEKLSRQALYASFRNPASKTGQIIKRMEEEKASKSSAVNADDLLSEI